MPPSTCYLPIYTLNASSALTYFLLSLVSLSLLLAVSLKSPLRDTQKNSEFPDQWRRSPFDEAEPISISNTKTSFFIYYSDLQTILTVLYNSFILHRKYKKSSTKSGIARGVRCNKSRTSSNNSWHFHWTKRTIWPILLLFQSDIVIWHIPPEGIIFFMEHNISENGCRNIKKNV